MSENTAKSKKTVPSSSGAAKGNEEVALGQSEGEANLELPSNVAPEPLAPEDLTRFALDNDVLGGTTAKVLTSVPVRKPLKESFIRTHPDPECWLKFGLIELKEAGKTYLLTPEVAATVEGQGESTLVIATLALTVDRQGAPFLWPLKESERENDWHLSARRAAELARTCWLRVVSNMSAGQYDAHVAQNQPAEPIWPEEPYREILGLAFRDRIIDTIDHPVLKDLRGEF